MWLDSWIYVLSIVLIWLIQECYFTTSNDVLSLFNVMQTLTFESYLSLVVCTCIYIAKMFSVTFTFNLHKKSLKLLYSKHWTNITDRFLPVSCIQWRGLGCDWLWSCVHPWSVWSPRRSPGRSWSSSRPQYWGNK